MAARDPHHRAPTTSGTAAVEANAPKRRSSTTTRVTAPKAPTAGSRMTSRRRSRSKGGNSPSAASASPSRCRYPVSATSAASAMPAAAAGGHARPANHHTPPTSRPMTAPTTGNQSSVPGDGTAAPPNGVKNAIALRTSGPEPIETEGATRHHEDDVVGASSDGLIERAQRVAKQT